MSKYTDLLIYQYNQKPRARATIDAWCDEADKIIDNLTDLLNQWDIDEARNYSLDIIGRRIGVTRMLPSFVAKGFFGYFNSINGLGWGEGRWFRDGDTTGDTVYLTDDDYRFLIKAKILKNFQNGTLDYVLYAVRHLLNEDANIEDNYDMTATIYLPLQSLNELQRYMIEQMDILPRPMGVKYTYTNASGKEFGFDGFYNSYGFNEGSFIDS